VAKKFPHIQQLGIKDCGPATLKMIAKWYGKSFDLNYLRQKCSINKIGVSMLGISEAAEAIGFRTLGVKLTTKKLIKAMDAGPCIIHWQNNHFVVLYKVKKRWFRGSSKRNPRHIEQNRNVNEDGTHASPFDSAQDDHLQDNRFTYYISDPAKGYLELRSSEFVKAWKGESEKGYALLLEPGQAFYADQREGEEQKADFGILWPYFLKYKRYFLQIVLSMLLGSMIALVGPFLTQSLVDTGINRQDINFVYLVLGAQLALFIGSTFIEIIRSWILMHIGTRINISMVSDFFKKLLNLPIKFYEQYVVGDLMQRIGDHSRIEKLLTVNTLSTIFSFLNILVLGSVLFIYNVPIFVVFFLGSLAGLLWILIFLKRRRTIDFKFFEAYAKNNNKVLEILGAVQDIKISNATRQKRWEWEEVQSYVYDVKMKSLTLSQVQGIGSSFINRAVGIAITFIAAKAVIEGEITLGTMFAITMIVGQISGPIGQILGFITTFQDAKIGLERINDITNKEDEDPPKQTLVTDIPKTEPIHIENLTFHYGSESLDPVLDSLELVIPAGKVTAIVGASGSGKTTMMKLLLKFYQPNKGDIFLGGYNFKSLHHGKWRENCGVVMQDGQLLSGTISDNIALGRETDNIRVIEAARMANIDSFINELPMGYMTELGKEGNQVSTGQKQRILLARAIYKDPAYLFLDEATSALDADNEKVIIENLNTFFKDRTVVVIAHRLSTVRNADNIVVVDKGKITEQGTHKELVAKKGAYYNLVKNQLELGS
jgi:ATP-binding cassette subfamily B protein